MLLRVDFFGEEECWETARKEKMGFRGRGTVDAGNDRSGLLSLQQFMMTQESREFSFPIIFAEIIRGNVT